MTNTPARLGRKAVDLTGQTFGRLTVLHSSGRSKSGSWIWACRCSCGNSEIRQVWSSSLIRGLTISCGCAQKEIATKASTKHGLSYHALHNIWQNMMYRCYRKEDRSYRWYGARGISVAEEWHTEAQFIADMSPRPKGAKLERKDNDGPYSKENCVWASDKEQARNRRSNRLVTIGAETKPAIEWCEITGVNYGTAVSRLNRGLPPEEAFSKEKIAPGPKPHLKSTVLSEIFTF